MSLSLKIRELQFTPQKFILLLDSGFLSSKKEFPLSSRIQESGKCIWWWWYKNARKRLCAVPLSMLRNRIFATNLKNSSPQGQTICNSTKYEWFSDFSGQALFVGLHMKLFYSWVKWLLHHWVSRIFENSL